jgi:hypothetical protein
MMTCPILAATTRPVATTRTSAATTRAARADAASLEAARGRFLAAIRAAREQYLHDLNALFSAAMKSEDLEQANTVKEAIRDAEDSTDETGRRRRSAQTRGGTKVTVRAHDDWQRGIEVHKGDRLELIATGEWCLNVNARAEHTAGPDGLRRNGLAGPWTLYSSLVARIGPRLYFVGRRIVIHVESDGLLEFRSNTSTPTTTTGR